ncbi:MAG TPA: chemotaxis protein CheD [Gallionella sp.]|nr:chemotaxis protein CheD [Gallionella sp.]
MNKPSHVIEIFLQPGDLYFGDRDTRIRTVLGSCVSLTFWHPKLLVGGMCHYMLPNRSHDRRRTSAQALDGRYADEAIDMMTKEIDAIGVPHREYQVKLFGGGNMFPGRSNVKEHVGMKNVDTARKLVIRHGFNCVAEHLGGMGHRNVIFDIWNGHVWVKHAVIARHEAAPEADKKDMDRRWPCVAFG